MADGERWFYLRDYKTHEVVISDYALTDYGKAKGFSVEFDQTEPVYFYTAQSGKNKGKDMPVFATPEGRLSLVIPHLFGRFNMFLALTNSIHDLGQISGELKSIADKADTFGIPMSEIPLVYSRRKEQISKPTSQGRIQADEWLCHIQPVAEWDMLATKLLERKSIYDMLPETVATPSEFEGIAALVDPIDKDIETGLGSLLPEQIDQPQELPETAGVKNDDMPEMPDQNSRPWSGQQVKSFLELRSIYFNEMASKFIDPEGARKNGIIASLNKLFGDDDKRHAALLYLFHNSSMSDATDAKLLSIREWLNIRKVDGEWVHGENVDQEAKNVLHAAMISHGQQELPL